MRRKSDPLNRQFSRPGTYKPTNGTSACSPCPPRTFNEVKGRMELSSCLMCPYGTDSPALTPLLIGEPLIIFLGCLGEYFIDRADSCLAFRPFGLSTRRMFRERVLCVNFGVACQSVASSPVACV